ncbi:hypothetical protein ISCGN_005487 [Ixodes scapularis]
MLTRCKIGSGGTVRSAASSEDDETPASSMWMAVVSRVILLGATLILFLHTARADKSSPQHRQPRSVCMPGFCKTVKCEEIEPTKCEGVVKYRASVCGCCPVCVKQLGFGDFCNIAVPLGARTAPAECGEALVCIDGKCVTEDI